MHEYFNIIHTEAEIRRDKIEHIYVKQSHYRPGQDLRVPGD
jgi:hypothetical protein